MNFTTSKYVGCAGSFNILMLGQPSGNPGRWLSYWISKLWLSALSGTSSFREIIVGFKLVANVFGSSSLVLGTKASPWTAREPRKNIWEIFILNSENVVWMGRIWELFAGDVFLLLLSFRFTGIHKLLISSCDALLARTFQTIFTSVDSRALAIIYEHYVQPYGMLDTWRIPRFCNLWTVFNAS